MNTLIEPIESAAQRDAATRIREEVFGREWRHQVTSPFEGSHAALHLLARSSPEGAAVATLSVVDTTADRNLHDSYGLAFDGRVKVARYTQLAVLKRYRGMNLPLRLILEAHRRFVAPGHFTYTWLLYRSEHAAESSLCRLLGFQPGTGTFESPYGRVRTLVRRETPAVAGEEIWRPQSPAGIAKTETVVSVFSSTAQ